MTEEKEASEQPSDVQEAQTEGEQEAPVAEETFEVGDTKVVFKEPTEADNPTDRYISRTDTGRIGNNFFSSENEWEATVIGRTPSNKEMQVVKRSDGHGYTIQWRQGGQIPDELQGWFTSYDKASQAGLVYLNKMWDKERAEAVN